MNIQNSPVNFGNEGGKKGFAKSFLSSTGGSLLNVGLTTAAGGSIGAIGGKIASLKPYTPNEAAMNFQYADMFEKAISSKELPNYLKDKPDDLLDIVKTGARKFKQTNRLNSIIEETESLVEEVAKAKDKVFFGEEFQNKLKELKFLKAPADGTFTKEGVLEVLSKRCEKLGKIVEKHTPDFNQMQVDFVEKAKNLKSPDMVELAENGAKSLRKNSVIGAGIAVGIIAMLVLNLLKTYGIIGGKGPKIPSGGQAPQGTQAPAAQGGTSAPIIQTPSLPQAPQAGTTQQ